VRRVLTYVLVAFLLLSATVVVYSQVGTDEDAVTYGYTWRYRPLRGGTQIQIEVVPPGGSLIATPKCSLGFPAYFETVEGGLGIITVYYGYVTASHCGYVYNSVYQNTTGTNNYIGYMRYEGRVGFYGVVNPNLPDATFIVVETYIYTPSQPRPQPQNVKPYIHHLGSIAIITNYITGESDIRYAHEAQLELITSGRTSGYEAARIIPAPFYVRTNYCRPSSPDYLFCYWYDYGWIFFVDTYGAPGDSGGPVYRHIVDSITRRHYTTVYGIIVGGGTPYDREWATCISGTYTGWLCKPTMVAPIYNITTAYGLTPYVGG